MNVTSVQGLASQIKFLRAPKDSRQLIDGNKNVDAERQLAFC
ncbi:hypothetical protein [Stieleria varia]|nr:hypothetical protein [Stieleria varia]